MCGTSVVKRNDKIVYYSPKQDILRHFSVERNIFSAFFYNFKRVYNEILSYPFLVTPAVKIYLVINTFYMRNTLISTHEDVP